MIYFGGCTNCINPSTECVVLNPSEYLVTNEQNCSEEICYNWECYSLKNITEIDFKIEPEITPESIIQTDNCDPVCFELKVHIYDGYPEPIINLNNFTFNYINESDNNHTIANFKVYYTDLADFQTSSLYIKQPGFNCTDNCPYITFQLEYIDDDNTAVSVVLGILIPLCIIISAGFSIYYCKKKQLFWFKNGMIQHQNVVVLDDPWAIEQNSSRAQDNIYHNVFQGDSNFTEIDLTDSPRPRLTPMSSYIETVTARYTKILWISFVEIFVSPNSSKSVQKMYC